MRALLLLTLLLAGCAHQRPAPFNPAAFTSPGIERSLQYWTAHHSDYPINHFYVYATAVDRGELMSALVYWREGGRVLDYLEEGEGSEAQAWRLRPKVDRQSLESDEAVTGRNDVVPHRVWVRWVDQCISQGREYSVTLKDAQAAFPAAKGS